MTTQAGVEIRLVKCPKCRKILPELPELPMYKCGGCGTVLQAKVRKPETNHTDLPSHKTDSAKGQLANALGQKEDRSSNDDLTDSPKVESSPDEGNIQRQDECDGSVVLSHNGGSSDGLSGSPDITSPRSESSPSKVQESVENNSLGRSPLKYQSKSGDHGEWTAASNSSNELPSSGEISIEAEAYTSEASEHVEQHDQSHLHLDYSSEQMKDGETQQGWPEGDNLVDEVQNLPEYEEQESASQERIKDHDVVPENEEMSRTSLTDQNGESSGEIKHVGPDSPSGITSLQNDIISPSAEVVDDGSKGLPVLRSLGTEKSTSPKSSVHAPQSPSKASLVSFYLTSDDEQLDHSPREAAHKFKRFSSMDTLESPDIGDLSSELKFRHGSTAYYPTSRSYYAYDGSESSYGGIDDQVCEHVSHLSRKDKDVSHTRTREEIRKDGFSGNNTMNSEAERTYGAMHHPWNRGRSTEANRYAGRNRMRVDAREDVSRLPLPTRDHTAGRTPAGFSGHQHNLLPPHPAYNLSDKSSYSDPDKMDLLRTVCHLKDQLQRMQFNPIPNNLLLPERDLYADVSHPSRYNRQRDNAKGYGDRYNEPRMAFSGEAAHFRHQPSCSCLHCCRQDRHYSAQLPSCSMHRENGHRVIHTDCNCCDRSNSSSPHRYASSEPSSWGSEAKPNKQRRDENKGLQLREKYNTGKRHIRPIAGGAPVIVCYHCSELLQLPVDFLLFKKRYHQLMCNACRKVLKFSFLKGTQLTPYVPDASAPPPSEANGYNGAASGQRNVGPAVSHSSSHQHVESLSCSDDYGRSFCRSCSTEVEVPLVSPSLDRGKMDSYGRKTLSGSSYEPIKDRKLKGILSEPRKKNEGSPESVEALGPSPRTMNKRNVTTSISEIEELPPLANSPLHRLMGYSTPSQVFKR